MEENRGVKERGKNGKRGGEVEGEELGDGGGGGGGGEEG